MGTRLPALTIGPIGRSLGWAEHVEKKMAYFSFKISMARQSLKSSDQQPVFCSLSVEGTELFATTQFVNYDKSGGPVVAHVEVMRSSELSDVQRREIGNGFVEFVDRFECEEKMVGPYIKAYAYVDDRIYDYLWEITKLRLIKGTTISFDTHPLRLGETWDVKSKEHERVPLSGFSVSCVAK